MKITKIAIAFIFMSLLASSVFCQETSSFKQKNDDSPKRDYKYYISCPYLTFNLFQMGDTPDINMYEFHFGKRIDSKNTIGIKAARWKIFEPMGIQFWDPNLLKKSEWFKGRIKEIGVGFTYQRKLWKGLYAELEIMPMWKTFVDEDGDRIENGFRLYTTYHIGYYISFFKNRLYIEPQIHCNYWPINSKGPEGFKEQIEKHNNYFLFEPNLYIGVNF